MTTTMGKDGGRINVAGDIFGGNRVVRHISVVLGVREGVRVTGGFRYSLAKGFRFADRCGAARERR